MVNTNQREIRVFLSSTFRDMDTERGHLVKHVFPRVRAACLARQVGFTEIDLRWGVTEEESKNGATVEICLREIDRCRDFPPFFIGFLGERYGWIPRDHELKAYWERHADSPYAKSIRDAVARGISVTELEMELAVFGNAATVPAFRPGDLDDRALFLLRDPAFSRELCQAACARGACDGDFFDEGGGKLSRLKGRIRESGLLGVDGYTAIELFGRAIEEHLLAALDRYFPQGKVPSSQARANAAHAAFRFERLQNFLPRPDVRQRLLAGITDRMEGRASGPLVLAGPPGQGKSAMMADLARCLEQEGAIKGHQIRVIDHYAGADESNGFNAWITRILNHLYPEVRDTEEDAPRLALERVKRLSTWASLAARRMEERCAQDGVPREPAHFLVLLDGAEQLAGLGPAQIGALKAATSSDCILVLSVTEGTQQAVDLSGFARVDVPAMDNTMRASFIRDTLTRFRKSLPEPEILRLARAPQCGSPLFLALALEELRVDAQHATLSSLVDQILSAPDAQHLLLNNFLLDPDYSRPEQPVLAARFMALLGAARSGLTENDLADLLALPGDPVAGDTGSPRLPQKHLSRLLANFGQFLSNLAGKRTLMYRSFGAVALESCGESAIRRDLHAFFSQGYGSGYGTLVEASAIEALHQATTLLHVDGEELPARRRRLVRDVSRLWVVTGVRKEEPDIVLAALSFLTEEERRQVGDAWLAYLQACDKSALVACAEAVAGCVGWMRQVHFDRCRLPRRLIEGCIEQLERLAPDEPLLLAKALSEQALVCSAMSDDGHVGELHERALAIRERLLGPEHEDTVTSLSNLASHLQRRGELADFTRARPLLERALAIREKTQGDGSQATANSLTNLAVYLAKSAGLEDRQAARQLLERALAIRQRIAGNEALPTASILVILASYLEGTGRPEDFTEAGEHLKRALGIRERMLGPDHHETASALCLYARHLAATGDTASLALAKTYHERVLAIRERVFGPDSVEVANSLNDLAELLRKTGSTEDYMSARQLYPRALAIREKRSGNAHPDTANVMSNFALYLKSTSLPEDREQAGKLFERALSVGEKSLGERHPDVAVKLNNLARFLKESGDPADIRRARGLLKRALQIWKRSVGLNHPRAAYSFNNLAECLRLTGNPGDLRAARALFARALAIREISLGADHRDTAISLHNLASCLLASARQEDLDVALLLLERALLIRKAVLVEGHRDIADTQSLLDQARLRRSE